MQLWCVNLPTVFYMGTNQLRRGGVSSSVLWKEPQGVLTYLIVVPYCTL